MNWRRAILDGMILAVAFNGMAAVFWLFAPEGFAVMYPKIIRKRPSEVPNDQLRLVRVMEFTLYPMLLLYMILSSYQAGVTGFWNLFGMAYVELWFVNLGDFFGLDCFLRGVLLRKEQIPHTEHPEMWAAKPWLTSLAIPEHFLLWPLVFAPLFGFICAGIGTLLP